MKMNHAHRIGFALAAPARAPLGGALAYQAFKHDSEVRRVFQRVGGVGLNIADSFEERASHGTMRQCPRF